VQSTNPSRPAPPRASPLATPATRDYPATRSHQSVLPHASVVSPQAQQAIRALEALASGVSTRSSRKHATIVMDPDSDMESDRLVSIESVESVDSNSQAGGRIVPVHSSRHNRNGNISVDVKLYHSAASHPAGIPANKPAANPPVAATAAPPKASQRRLRSDSPASDSDTSYFESQSESEDDDDDEFKIRRRFAPGQPRPLARVSPSDTDDTSSSTSPSLHGSETGSKDPVTLPPKKADFYSALVSNCSSVPHAMLSPRARSAAMDEYTIRSKNTVLKYILAILACLCRIVLYRPANYSPCGSAQLGKHSDGTQRRTNRVLWGVRRGTYSGCILLGYFQQSQMAVHLQRNRQNRHQVTVYHLREAYHLGWFENPLDAARTYDYYLLLFRGIAAADRVNFLEEAIHELGWQNGVPPEFVHGDPFVIAMWKAVKAQGRPFKLPQTVLLRAPTCMPGKTFATIHSQPQNKVHIVFDKPSKIVTLPPCAIPQRALEGASPVDNSVSSVADALGEDVRAETPNATGASVTTTIEPLGKSVQLHLARKIQRAYNRIQSKLPDTPAVANEEVPNPLDDQVPGPYNVEAPVGKGSNRGSKASRMSANRARTASLERAIIASLFEYHANPQVAAHSAAHVSPHLQEEPDAGTDGTSSSFPLFDVHRLQAFSAWDDNESPDSLSESSSPGPDIRIDGLDSFPPGGPSSASNRQIFNLAWDTLGELPFPQVSSATSWAGAPLNMPLPLMDGEIREPIEDDCVFTSAPRNRDEAVEAEVVSSQVDEQHPLLALTIPAGMPGMHTFLP
jgi:hypothetical protein